MEGLGLGSLTDFVPLQCQEVFCSEQTHTHSLLGSGRLGTDLVTNQSVNEDRI